MKNITIADLIDGLKKAKSKTERANLLKSNDCAALRGLLRMNFDTTLELSLPQGEPPYKKLSCPPGFGETTLKASAKGWYVFLKGTSPTLKQSKREQLFIQLLEQLDPTEAQILLDAKDRKLQMGVTRKLIDEVFPGLIKSEVKVNGKKESSRKSTPDTGDGQVS
jgi:hypothetical protein